MLERSIPMCFCRNLPVITTVRGTLCLMKKNGCCNFAIKVPQSESLGKL